MIRTRRPSAPITIQPARLSLAGPWQVQVQVTVRAGKTKRLSAVVDVVPPALITVTAERYDALPAFNPNAGGWGKGVPLVGLRAQECTTCHALEPESLRVSTGPEADALVCVRGRDYEADLAWGTVGRLAGARVGADQPVFISYRYALLRLDAVVLTAAGRIVVRQGRPHNATPLPPRVGEHEVRLANIWVNGRLERLTADHLFPVLETAFPAPAKPARSSAERLLPATMAKLRAGQPLRVLAWGDSVTDASYLPELARDRWQEQFVRRLRQRFPRARIELITEAWGGRNTSSYLAEPPGAEHNYREKVLDVQPDLIVSEFVNDAWMTPAQTFEQYGRLLADFRAIGAEWLILTPHYVRGDWMGLTSERRIDRDPRPYVTAVRQFARQNRVALADAARRYGRLWRQGLPYSSLMMNNINHPDPRGMRIFADSLMALFA